MDTKNNWMDVGEKIVYALLAALGSMVCVMGYYPLVPAIYASYCMDKRKNFLLYIGLFAGMGFRMPIGAVVKYLFVILVLGMAIRFYTWANRRCGGWTAGLIAGLVAAAMNCSGLLFSQMERGELVMGLCEGIMVCGLTVIFHYVLQMAFELCKRFWVRGPVSGSELEETAHVQDTGGRMYAFAEAMDELSVAFSAMGSRSRMSDHERDRKSVV